MANSYNRGASKNNAFIEKIFENIDKEQEQTEFERTEVHGLQNYT
jgi:hypothetical protein